MPHITIHNVSANGPQGTVYRQNGRWQWRLPSGTVRTFRPASRLRDVLRVIAILCDASRVNIRYATESWKTNPHVGGQTFFRDGKPVEDNSYTKEWKERRKRNRERKKAKKRRSNPSLCG